MDMPTGESLAVSSEDYENDFIPGASHFFQIDRKEFSLENFQPTNGLPSNPKDYLKSVMYEAQNCPDVVVAKVDLKKMKKKEVPKKIFSQSTIPGGEYAPESSWVDEQMKQFTSARHQYMRHQAKLKSINKQTKKRPKLPVYPLPSWKDEENWRYFCLGSKLKKRKKASAGMASPMSTQNDETDDNDESDDDSDGGMGVAPSPQTKALADEDNIVDLSTLKEGFPPTMRILLRMESRQIDANLDFHTEWIDEYGFSHEQGRWIYALLTCLQKPLFPTVTSSLRNLSRKCAKERAIVTDSDADLLCGLNLIIAVIGNYFNQYDLLDKR